MVFILNFFNSTIPNGIMGGNGMAGWINESIFYHIYPIGFCGAPTENSFNEEKGINRIQKVEKWIPHFQELGINAIYFGPLFESSVHGYDTADYYRIDRRLGTNEDFKEVAKKLHEAGIRIVLDGVFNHVGRDFWAFKDIQQYGPNSRYTGWFQNLNFGGKSPYGDDFWYEGWEGHYDLVKLNLSNPEVIEHILGAVGMWMDTFAIDGLRLDVAYCMDQAFLKQLRKYCESKKTDFWLMGEMIHGDYTRIANRETLHSATNYEGYKGIYSSHNDKNYFEINYSLNRLFGQGGIYKELTLYNFVDNHDVDRIASILKNPEHIYNVYTLLFTIPGVPAVYYGSEWGTQGSKQNGSDLALRSSFEETDKSGSNTKLIKHIADLATIRKQSPVLCYGTFEQVVVKNEQLIFKRTHEGTSIFALFNISDKESTLDFKTGDGNYAEDLLNTHEHFEIQNGHISVSMAPFCSRILIVKNG